jgi:hypothetical protein
VPTLFIWAVGRHVGRAAAEGTGEFIAVPYQFAALAGVRHYMQVLHSTAERHMPWSGARALPCGFRPAPILTKKDVQTFFGEAWTRRDLPSYSIS